MVRKATALISGGLRRKTETGPVLFGVGLQDAREEQFVRMACDGLALGVAFARAGFTSRHNNAAHNLWQLPRIQARAQAVLEARRTTGVVSLNEVTDMLKRVFAGAHSEGEYSAAHNAAFSLARLYGHVTDRTSLEVIRRPSRDPDAPSEQALTSWVDSLPGPVPGLPGPALENVDFLRVASAPAAPLGQGPELDQGPGPEKPNEINWLDSSEPSSTPSPQGPGLEISNDIKGLGPTPGRPENGAPPRPVTGTPNPRARAEPLGPGGSEKGAPGNMVTGTGTDWGAGDKTGEREFPSAEDLFG